MPKRNRANGCLTWDRVLLKLLRKLFQSACPRGAGDAARAKLYTGLQYVCYKDLKLTLKPQLQQVYEKLYIYDLTILIAQLGHIL